MSKGIAKQKIYRVVCRESRWAAFDIEAYSKADARAAAIDMDKAGELEFDDKQMEVVEVVRYKRK